MLESLDAEGIIASASASSSIVSNPVYVQSDSTTEIEEWACSEKSAHVVKDQRKDKRKKERRENVHVNLHVDRTPTCTYSSLTSY